MTRYSGCLVWGLLMLMSLFVAPWAVALDSTFSADFTLSKQTLPLNESLEVTLTLHYPDNYQIAPGILRDHLLQAPFNLVKETSSPITVEDTYATQTLRYTLEPKKTGRFWVSFFTVSFFPKAGTAGKKVSSVVAGQPIAVVPAAMPRQRLPLADLAPLARQLPVSLDRPSQLLMFAKQEMEPGRNQHHLAAHTFPWHHLAALAILCTLGCGLMVAFSHFRRYKAIGVAARRPLVKAIQRLDALEHSQAVKTRNFEVFFIEVTGTVRQYVEEMTGIPAKEETTQEFLDRVTESQYFSAKERQLLADLLTYADQVKFAKKPSTAADCLMAISYAREVLARK